MFMLCKLNLITVRTAIIEDCLLLVYKLSKNKSIQIELKLNKQKKVTDAKLG
jgi:hypothetical protein